MNYNSWNNRGRGRFRRRAGGSRFAPHRRRIVDREASDSSQGDDQAPSSSPEVGNHSNRRRASVQSPYPGWTFYFPDEDYPPDSSVSQRLKLLEAYFAERVSKFAGPAGLVDRSRSSYEVRVDQIADDSGVKEEWPDFKESLKCRPHDVLKLLGRPTLFYSLFYVVNIEINYCDARSQ